MPQKKVSLEGYVSVTDVIKECKRNGVKVNPESLKWRIGHGKIPAIRDSQDIRKRRLIPVGEIPNIIVYYSLLEDAKNGKYYSLLKLAKDIGLKERSLHPRANKLGIETFKIGNRRVMEKREYDKWRIILKREQERKRNCVSLSFVGKQFGVSHNSILYRIKKGEIPATRIGYKHKIPKKEFEEHGDEWRKRCGYSNNNAKGSNNSTFILDEH